MAIQMQYTDISGLVLSTAYLRCLLVSIGVEQRGSATVPHAAHLEFGVYVDRIARQGGALPLRVLMFNLPDDGTDPSDYFSDAILKQKDRTPYERAYAYIKTLPAYADGIDV